MALALLCLDENIRRPRLFRERIGIDSLRDWEILSRYRLDRPSIEELTDILREDLKKSTIRSQSITPEIQVLCGLRFVAKGSFLSEIGDIHGISKTSASLAIERFIDAINSKLDNIRFPENTLSTKVGFYKRCGVPNVIGAIDGTLIPIIAPAENEASFVCRKGYHAINAQAVVNADMRFTDIVARWPGSQHDAFIFDNSAFKTMIQEQDGYLLGDSGYPLRPYLMTPVSNPSNQAEEKYNRKHIQGRQVVENAFGILKSRFRCLHKSGGCLPFKPGKCCRVFAACTRLHNFCLDRKIPLIEPVDPEDELQQDCIQQIHDHNQTGQARRRRLIQQLN